MGAAVVTEAAVKFVKKPTAAGGAKQITISGSTDVGGYVYCAVSKTASRLRMLNATANASDASNATKSTTPTAVEAVNLQSASTAAKYNIQRQETKTGALSFSMTFSGLAEGKTYSWLCEAPLCPHPTQLSELLWRRDPLLPVHLLSQLEIPPSGALSSLL